MAEDKKEKGESFDKKIKGFCDTVAKNENVKKIKEYTSLNLQELIGVALMLFAALIAFDSDDFFSMDHQDVASGIAGLVLGYFYHHSLMERCCCFKGSWECTPRNLTLLVSGLAFFVIMPWLFIGLAAAAAAQYQLCQKCCKKDACDTKKKAKKEASTDE